jgi:hypothetical protein
MSCFRPFRLSSMMRFFVWRGMREDFMLGAWERRNERHSFGIGWQSEMLSWDFMSFNTG